MALTFDASLKRIILDVTTVTATELYSRWCDWTVLSDNSKYLPAFRAVGGDDLGGGLSIPPYYFLLNGWRIRPLELDHTLTVTGNLFVEGGGDPVVHTLGNFNVLVKTVVPVQAQGISTGATGGTLTAAEVVSEMDANSAKLMTLVSQLNTVIGYVDELETRITANRAAKLDSVATSSETADAVWTHQDAYSRLVANNLNLP